MPMKRSKPLMIASLLPVLAFVSLVLTERLHGTPYLPFFVAGWSLLLAALFTYVLIQTVHAKRVRSNR